MFYILCSKTRRDIGIYHCSISWFQIASISFNVGQIDPKIHLTSIHHFMMSKTKNEKNIRNYLILIFYVVFKYWPLGRMV